MTKLESLFLTLCVLLRTIFRHPDATKRLRQALAECMAEVYNEQFKENRRPGGPESTVMRLRAITYTHQFSIHEDEAAEDFPLPERGYEDVALMTLFEKFGEAIAQIIEHPDVEDSVVEALGSLPIKLQNLGKPNDTPASDQIAVRLILPAYLRMFAGMNATRANVLLYAPEVEARRVDYERLAECWVTLASIENFHGCENNGEVDLPNKAKKAPVMRAFLDHLSELFYTEFDWFHPPYMRHFYPEMRLAIDQAYRESQQRLAAMQSADEKEAA